MSNTYCVQCGAVNQIGDNDCIGCGAYLAAQPTYATPAEPGRWTAAQPNEWTAEPREWQPSHAPLTALRGIRVFGFGHTLATTLKLFTNHLWLITKIVFLV